MGMCVQEEWVYWKDESSMNLDSQGGLYPRVSRSKFLGHLDTKIFYCYYTPMPGGSLGVCAFLTLCLVYNQRTCCHGNIHSLSLLTMTSFYIIKKTTNYFKLVWTTSGDLVRSSFSWSLFGSFQFGNHIELFLFLREGGCCMLSGCMLFYHHYTEKNSLLKHVCITERLNHCIVSYCLFAVTYLQSVNRICGTCYGRNTRVTSRSFSSPSQ